MLKWTARIMAARAAGRGCPLEVYQDARYGATCLVGEAAEILDLTYSVANARLSERIGVLIRGPAAGLSVGDTFPVLLAAGDLARAERLCLKVEDALDAIKREKA